MPVLLWGSNTHRWCCAGWYGRSHTEQAAAQIARPACASFNDRCPEDGTRSADPMWLALLGAGTSVGMGERYKASVAVAGVTIHLESGFDAELLPEVVFAPGRSST